MVGIGVGGVSRGGKSTFRKALIEKYPDIFTIGVSTTTREMREGEEEGVDYYFVNKKDIKPSKFLEAEYFNDHYYGIQRKELERAHKEGKIPVFVVEPKGLNTLLGTKEITIDGKTEPLQMVSVLFDIPKDKIIEQLGKEISEEDDSAAYYREIERIERGNIPEEIEAYGLATYADIYKKDFFTDEDVEKINNIASYASDYTHRLIDKEEGVQPCRFSYTQKTIIAEIVEEDLDKDNTLTEKEIFSGISTLIKTPSGYKEARLDQTNIKAEDLPIGKEYMKMLSPEKEKKRSLAHRVGLPKL